MITNNIKIKIIIHTTKNNKGSLVPLNVKIEKFKSTIVPGSFVV